MSQKTTRSKIPLRDVYTPRDIESIDYGVHLNDPGLYPYTRGRRVGGGLGWIHRELSGEGDPKRSNGQLRYLIEKGQMGIDVIGDSPTMACIDPDHPLAAHALGTQGVSLCCLQDYQELLDNLPLESISISTSLPAAFAVAGIYLVAKGGKVPPKLLRGSVIQAPFYAEECGYSMHMPFRLRLRLTTDCIEFCTKEMPKFHSFLEDTYFFSETGLNAVEEMSLGFLEIRHVVRALIKRGLDIDAFAPRIAILVNCSMDLFEEVAKIRATRRLFATMMKEDFGARDPRSWNVVITSHTSGLSLTAQQPFNNIVRGALQAFAMVLAGVQALEISAFDEAYRTPSPTSHLIGLRTQQVIQLETNVTSVADPLGGAYYIESLTHEMEDRIRDRVREMEALGDPADLSDKGWFKRFFDDAMERYARQIRDREVLKVGLNIHQIPEKEDTLLKDVAETKIEPCWDRIPQIEQYKKSRDQKQILKVLSDVGEAAMSETQNIMFPLIKATEAGATMGEIAGVLRTAYGYPFDPHGMVESPLGAAS